MELNKYIDHTLLKPEASEEQILKLCDEALEYRFYSVCVNSCHVPLAVDKLSDSDVKVAAVAGFPLGAMSTASKVFEAREAVEAGASEIDMVINVGALKEGRYEYVLHEIAALVDVCHGYPLAYGDVATSGNASLKVIIETCLLTDEEIVKACELAVAAGADFVKTSTGFSTGGATAEAVSLMRNTVGNKAKIKASGGIRTLADAKKFIELGADRLGCSAGVQIMKENE
ncbi:MAG: deoxyribose-phosphate aldolase [Firmicutes bacterium]|nr:deoxyribose-phosphate aldolase [Bacillota bacterium]